MRFFSLFKEENIIIDIQESMRENILAKMISSIMPKIEEVTLNKIIAKVIQQEESPWFAPAPMVLVPHARIDEIEEFKVALAISKNGIKWDEEDGRPLTANVIFLLLTPVYENMRMIQTLDAIDRFCELKHNIDSLLNAVSEAKAIKQIEESGIDVKTRLTAEYLMNTEVKTVTPEHSLRDATWIMIRNQEDAIPVLNEQKELIGEFTSHAVLRVGVPNYMNILTNVDFISNFEPFENYYKKERFMKIKELISDEYITTSPDASVIEVAYELISKRKRRIYVVQNNKFLGTIYRRDILSKILLA